MPPFINTMNDPRRRAPIAEEEEVEFPPDLVLEPIEMDPNPQGDTQAALEKEISELKAKLSERRRRDWVRIIIMLRQ